MYQENEVAEYDMDGLGQKTISVESLIKNDEAGSASNDRPENNSKAVTLSGYEEDSYEEEESMKFMKPNATYIS